MEIELCDGYACGRQSCQHRGLSKNMCAFTGDRVAIFGAYCPITIVPGLVHESIHLALYELEGQEIARAWDVFRECRMHTKAIGSRRDVDKWIFCDTYEIIDYWWQSA